MESPKKLLLALQFWERDKPLGMKVARLIADLQLEHSDRADFLFVSRFDCKQDDETVKYVSRKFNVHTAKARRRGTGWPAGCNDLWFSTMDHCYEHTVAKKFPVYKAILTFESDCCPITPDWIEKLHHAWDEAHVNTLGVLCPYPTEHINGNALFSGDPKFLFEVSRQITGCPAHKGWDWCLSEEFKERGWANCPMMRSLYAYRTLGQDEFVNLLRAGVCFIHGVKDGSPIKYVREKYLR